MKRWRGAEVEPLAASFVYPSITLVLLKVRIPITIEEVISRICE